MTDRKKVIKGLRGLYGSKETIELIADAIALLKEQPEIVRCKDCKHRDPEDKRCDSGHGIRCSLPRPDDWFCADGEVK